MKKNYTLLIGLFFLIGFGQAQAQTYVGSESCQTCHIEKYTDWAASGHPYKFNVTSGNVGPVYPVEAVNFQSQWLENLGNGTHGWENIAGVIGGYGWKARFVGTDGHIIGTAGSAFSTGLGQNQFNFRGGENHGWVNYHPGDQKIYNYSCFKCHTTGGTQEGTWLEGVVGLGTFTEGGIGCEACHGPGSDHIASPSKENIDLVYEQAHADNTLGGLSMDGVVQTPDPNGDDVNFMCGSCHNRDYKAQINVSGGFIKHHEQWDEMATTKHGGEDLSCSTCHDPHKRTIWNGDGIIKNCTECHTEHEDKINHAAGITCIDCHMPFAAKSGTTRGESGYKGDVRSHLFAINTGTESMFTEDGNWVRDDEDRSAALSPHFACMSCHNDDPNDDIPDKTIEQASALAADMHRTFTSDDYRGSESCQACHVEKYTDWAASGHPYKFNVTSGNVGPVYPAEAVNFQSQWLENLGNGTHGWENIAGVIGGYGWKARFVGTDGHIIGTAGSAFSTGLGQNQFNFMGGENHGWANYHPGDVKIYNYSCFKCHTTGGTQEGTWLEGVEGLGTFTEGGIGCEACHGPGAAHSTNPSKENIDLVYEQAHADNTLGGLSVDGVVQTPNPNGDDVNFMCGSCHNRDYKAQINVSGGFIKHHEQWDEFTATKHGDKDLTCNTCHDPHKRVIWDGDGIIKNCTECHTGHEDKINHAPGVTCIDCHMPFAAKSGTTRGESGYKGDVRSHLLVINPSTESMFTEDGKWVRDDEDRSAALSPHFACLGCHNDDDSDNIPNKTVEQVAAAAADMHTTFTADDYRGSEGCQACHVEKYTDWAASGHPYKFNVTSGNVGPVYPVEAVNFQYQWLENLGNGTHGWENIAGVIGGYGWKARFVGTDGHIIGTAGSAFSTGLGQNQFNFYGGENHGWANYHPGDQKIYNYSCFKCHTTGGTQEGTWLEGVEGLGTFTEGGIGCEACHGPGALHATSPSKENIDLVYEQAHADNTLGGLSVDGVVQTPDPNGDDVNFMCGTCHNRDYTNPINSSGGFIKHHEQWDEFTVTKHGEYGFSCLTCHDPHKRVIWDGDGITKTCESCHVHQESFLNHAPGITCIDCHMPFAAKSGTTRGESGYKGDVRSHLFTINTSAESMFIADGSAVRDDESREAALSPHFACLGCHNDDPNDDIPNKTIEAAVAGAIDMHSEFTSVDDFNNFGKGLTIYPNPSTGPFTFKFNSKETGQIDLRIFDITGRLVHSRVQGSYQGINEIYWDGKDNQGMEILPGAYFIDLKNGNEFISGKMIKR